MHECPAVAGQKHLPPLLVLGPPAPPRQPLNCRQEGLVFEVEGEDGPDPVRLVGVDPQTVALRSMS